MKRSLQGTYTFVGTYLSRENCEIEKGWEGFLRIHSIDGIDENLWNCGTSKEQSLLLTMYYFDRESIQDFYINVNVETYNMPNSKVLLT